MKNVTVAQLVSLNNTMKTLGFNSYLSAGETKVNVRGTSVNVTVEAGQFKVTCKEEVAFCKSEVKAVEAALNQGARVAASRWNELCEYLKPAVEAKAEKAAKAPKAVAVKAEPAEGFTVETAKAFLGVMFLRGSFKGQLASVYRNKEAGNTPKVNAFRTLLQAEEVTVPAELTKAQAEKLQAVLAN